MQAPGPLSVSQRDLDAELLYGAFTPTGRGGIYEFYRHYPGIGEAIRFLKKHYGTSGHSMKFMDGTAGFVMYNAKGLAFSRNGSEETYTFPWNAVERRIRQLIQDGVYSAIQTPAPVENTQSTPEPAAEVSHNKPTATTVAVYPAEKNNIPYDILIETLHIPEPEQEQAAAVVVSDAVEPNLEDIWAWDGGLLDLQGM